MDFKLPNQSIIFGSNFCEGIEENVFSNLFLQNNQFGIIFYCPALKRVGQFNFERARLHIVGVV